MENKLYQLTHIEPVEPMDCGNLLIAQCPKCGAGIEVDRPTVRCHRCGMMFSVAREKKGGKNAPDKK